MVFMDAEMIRLADLEPKEATNEVKDTKALIVARSVVVALSDMDEGTAKIGSKKLKPLVDARVGFKVSKKVWLGAIKHLEQYPTPLIERGPKPPGVLFHDSRNIPSADTLADAGWRRTPQGFQRLTAADYGFGCAVGR